MSDKTTVQLPIRWNVPPGLPLRYATNLVMQCNPHEFCLSFFEVQPPILLGTPEAQASQATALKEMPAECIARIVVAPERMREFLKVMNDTWTRYEQERLGPSSASSADAATEANGAGESNA